jgi:hypothetical protein
MTISDDGVVVVVATVTIVTVKNRTATDTQHFSIFPMKVCNNQFA